MNVSCSFLRARDPSIISWNICRNKENVRINLEKHFQEESKEKENLEVFLRLKHCEEDIKNIYGINENNLSCIVPNGSNFNKNVKEGDVVVKKFKFSKIFDGSTSQSTLFNDVVKPRLLNFINGFNSTLLTYGSSGSGKTYTIVGTDSEPGIIPRALEYLFKSLEKFKKYSSIKPHNFGSVVFLNKDESAAEKKLLQNIISAFSSNQDNKKHIKTYKSMQQRLSNEPVASLEEPLNVLISIWVSFAEIYNEQIYDLLLSDQPDFKDRTKLKLAKTADGDNFIKNLTNISVSSALEAYQVLQYGLNYLHYASTCVNSHSSRSHSIFTIKLVQTTKDGKQSNINYFNFCDLAGSERLKKTQNVGDRLKESNNINTSLLVLHRCIVGVRELQKKPDNNLIPFRESKLTQLFQKALSGLESICMIVNINPTLQNFDQTQNVLNFSAIAKDIEIKSQQITVPKKVNRFSKYIQGRSTAFSMVAPIREEDEESEQIEKLIEVLYNENHNLKEDIEHMIKEKAKLSSDYMKIIDEREEEWKKKFKRLEELNDKLESELESKRKKIKLDSSVIVIDDSLTDEETEDTVLKNKIKEYEAELREVILKNIKIEVELREANAKVQVLEGKVKELQDNLKKADDDNVEKSLIIENLKERDRDLTKKLLLTEESMDFYVKNEVSEDTTEITA